MHIRFQNCDWKLRVLNNCEFYIYKLLNKPHLINLTEWKQHNLNINHAKWWYLQRHVTSYAFLVFSCLLALNDWLIHFNMYSTHNWKEESKLLEVHGMVVYWWYAWHSLLLARFKLNVKRCVVRFTIRIVVIQCLVCSMTLDLFECCT